MPLPHREDALVQRQRRGGLLLLLRLPGVGRRHHLRARHGPPRLRRRRALPGRPGRHHPARGPGDRAATTSAAPSCSDAMERAVRVVPRAAAALARRRPGPGLPALARLRRRRRAPVPAGLGARRLGRPGQGAAAARERALGLGPRLRQPARPRCRTSSGPGCCSRSATPPAVPSRSAGASCRPARARHRPTGPSPSTRTRRSRRSTRSAGRSTRSTGPRRASSPRARSSCARATPTSSAASRPACRGPSPPVAPRWPRSTSRCCATSPSASCWPTTPTRPGRARPRAVYEWERKHEVDVVVADLPGGSDPGDLARTDPDGAGPGHQGGPAVPAVPGRPHARAQAT